MITKKTKKEEVKEVKKKVDGLEQKIVSAGGKNVVLRAILSERDTWQTKGRNILTIITHDGVKKVADIAGISKNVKYAILTQPSAYNNYQYTMQATVCMLKDENNCATEIGEANRSNLGSRGRKNPANMAQKRAYDRAVMRLLDIKGLLSENELPDEDKTTDNKMENLTHEERKIIAPIINRLVLAKTKEHFIIFNREMKDTVKNNQFSDASLDYVRKLYKKQLAELQKVSF